MKVMRLSLNQWLCGASAAGLAFRFALPDWSPGELFFVLFCASWLGISIGRAEDASIKVLAKRLEAES